MSFVFVFIGDEPIQAAELWAGAEIGNNAEKSQNAYRKLLHTLSESSSFVSHLN